ncbi:hypothetical protein V5N11_016048 [Cardamine amara subsp. amara]|uniref:Reverse transcriptase domain-containing protein n=1 Tax=Cardamine amara subsp. amara TaxID=228776 RepID=A0ABD1AEI6_CARAN
MAAFEGSSTHTRPCNSMDSSSTPPGIPASLNLTRQLEQLIESNSSDPDDWSELKAPKVDLKPLPNGLRFHLENETQSSIEPQRRLSPNLKEVIKKKILKLLDAGIIYPIFDSTWVSPVHCIPKKGGITVIKNDKDELIPTRIITSHHMCIDYRKLLHLGKISKSPILLFP